MTASPDRRAVCASVTAVTASAAAGAVSPDASRIVSNFMVSMPVGHGRLRGTVTAGRHLGKDVGDVQRVRSAGRYDPRCL
jgi:hypothetical protein